MKTVLLNIISLVITFQSFSQIKFIDVPMTKEQWDVPAKASFEALEGRKTLNLNGKAYVKNIDFSDGSIQVDVYANSKRSFAGIVFRKQNHFMEEIYMRLHKSRQVDAVQYTPVFNGESNWQLYREYQANVEFKTKVENLVKVKHPFWFKVSSVNEVVVIDSFMD